MDMYYNGKLMISDYPHCEIKWIYYNRDELVMRNGLYLAPIDREPEDNPLYLPLAIADCLHLYDKIIYVVSVITDDTERGKGYGTKAVLSFIKGYSLPILLQAGVLDKDLYEELDKDPEKFTEFLNRLERFYTRIGFRNVNNFIGCCEDCIVMLFNNDSELSNLQVF